MPFNWNAEAVPEDVRAIEVDGQMRVRAVTQAIVYATMSVGMPRITEKNAREFFVRVAAWERLMGAGQHDSNLDPVFISADDVRRHIGLYTNAPSMTATQFRTHAFRRAEHRDGGTYDIAAQAVASIPAEVVPE